MRALDPNVNMESWIHPSGSDIADPARLSYTPDMSRVKRDRADDLEAIRMFLERVQRVEGNSIVRQQVGSQLQVSWRQGEPLRFQSTEPNEESLGALLLVLRPLVVLGESINLGAIFDIGERRLRTDDHRRALREGREAWRIAQRKGMLALRINERDLSPEYVMRLWINGYYFHAEPALEAELRGMAGPGRTLSKHVFLDYIYRALECVIWTASVLQDAIDRDVLEA